MWYVQPHRRYRKILIVHFNVFSYVPIHSFGFPNMIQEGGSFDPFDCPLIRPCSYSAKIIDLLEVVQRHATKLVPRLANS